MKYTCVFGLLIIILWSGCASQPATDRFQLSNTINRSDFLDLHPVSIESLKAHEEELLRNAMSTSRSFRKLSQNCPQVGKTAEIVEKISNELYETKMAKIRELEALINGSGSIFFFNYAGDKNVEFGWMVVTNNKIKAKVLLGEGVVINRKKQTGNQ